MIWPTILFGEELVRKPPIDKLTPPTVFTGQRLRALLQVPLDKEHQSHMFDTVKLVLKGQITSLVTLGGFCWRIKRPLVRMSCVRLLEDFNQTTSEDSNQISNDISFFFDIPEYITLPSLYGAGKRETFDSLPPSIKIIKKASNEWLVGNRSGVCDVAYHVEANFFKCGRSVAEWRREINVIPAGETPPPIDPEGLKQEYTLSATSSFGSFWKRKRSIALFGSSSEPRPFVIQDTTHTNPVPATNLILNFSAKRMLDSRLEAKFSEPPFTICEIIVTMEAIAIFQQQEQESVMSLAEAGENRLAVFKTTRFKPQIHQMNLMEWFKTRETVSGSSRIVDWNTVISVTTLLPCDAPKLPSFFSTLVSQRYAFDVEIRFGTEHGIRSQKPMRLRIPVQIVHARVHKSFSRGDLPDARFEDDLVVPAYAP